jgi:hypothetical protein
MTWNNNYMFEQSVFWGGPFSSFFTALLAPLVLWSLVWKGWALWRAAKNDSKPWFIVLLLVNTLGILDMFYIFVFGKNKSTKETKSTKVSKRSSR